MKESVWAWYLPMTDWMDDLMPSVLFAVAGNKYTAVAMGVNQLCHWSTGPPHLINQYYKELIPL